ncbi:MAG: hypothetical protein M3N82_16145 [Pseudomonadota bacterium]|nr:hypothetical protein [Pseudomonadota bacterium]
MSNCIVPGRDGAAAKVTSFRDAVDALSPALDSVELWLTPTVEQDFEQRGAFPELRKAHAAAVRSASGWGLHFLVCGQAELVLADCVRRITEVAGGVMNSYHGHERRLRQAMKEAQEREALFRAAAPRRVDAFGDQERWVGTSEQFRAMGVTTFPGDGISGARSKLRTVDSRGYSARVCRNSSLWPGLFEVTITLPKAARTKPASQPSPDLVGLAPTQVVFRRRATEVFERIAIDLRNHLQSDVGYRYSKEAVESFMDAMAEAREALQVGSIVGRSQDQEIQRAAALRAKDDKPLQAFIARMGELPLEPDA